MQKVAIFDVDGTIFRSSLLIELVDAFVEANIFPQSIMETCEKSKTNWLNREGGYIGAVVQVFENNIKGIKQSDFIKIAEIVIQKQAKRTYTYTPKLIKDLKNQGYFILAVSQSPKMILDLFCSTLGFDKVYGRMYDVDSDGVLTGDTQNLDLIPFKDKVLQRALEKEGLTLDESVGVGDTEGDISFLSLVTNPICFNPNQKLYQTAKENGWKVVVERKDVIFEIPN